MASELRWILAAICAVLLLGIWWWGARRSRQAAGNAELRESTVGAAPARDPPAADKVDLGTAEESRDWGVPPFEPLSIRTTDFEYGPVVDVPMTALPDSLEETLDLGEDAEQFTPAVSPAPMDAMPNLGADAAAVEPECYAEPPPAPAAAPLSLDTAVTGSNIQGPNVSETQRIVSVRVSATGDERWSGPGLLAALDDHGLAFGRYQVFHRRHSDGRTLFCAASLVEPGTFNLARMPEEEFRGLTLFAVLPGPSDPLQTFDALIQTAVELAEALHGVVQDSKGVPLSQQRAEALRVDVARFQALLTMT